MLGVLMIGMLVPYDNPALLSSTVTCRGLLYLLTCDITEVGTAAQSPFVIALSSAGVKCTFVLDPVYHR